MSVSSDFWETQEPPGSSARRLAQSLRRASTRPSLASTSTRSSTLSSGDEPRRASVVTMPFRIPKYFRAAGKTSALPEHAAGSRLGELFLSLPNEIQMHILYFIDLPDVLNLRLVSRSFHTLLQSNASTVTRHMLPRTYLGDKMDFLLRLYPLPHPHGNLEYLLKTLRRQTVIKKTVDILADFIQRKIYLIRSGPRIQQFQPYGQRLKLRLREPALVVCHYLESLQGLHLIKHPRLFSEHSFPQSPNYLLHVAGLAEEYEEEDLVPAYQFYKLLLLHLRQSLRAPTYAGTLERTLRGWAGDPAKDEEIAQVLIFGGLEQVVKVMEAANYKERLDRTRDFLDKLSGAAKTSTRKQSETEDISLSLNDLWAMPFDQITAAGLKLSPPLDEILITTFQDRIVLERLVDHERELASPFGFIQRLMTDTAKIDGQNEEDQISRPARALIHHQSHTP